MMTHLRRCGSILVALWLSAGVIAVPVAASTITGAFYSGDIVVTNTSFASAQNTIPFTLSTQTLITNKYIESDCLNTAVTDGTGVDVAYQPAVAAGSTWMIWENDIQQNANNLYKLYIGGADMAGKIRYFPDAAGMSVNDAASLEPASSFEIETSGYVNTASGASKDIVSKAGAVTTSVTNTGEITSIIYPVSSDNIYFGTTADGQIVASAGAYATAQAAASGTATSNGSTFSIGQSLTTTTITQNAYDSGVNLYSGAITRAAAKGSGNFTGIITSVKLLLAKTGSPTGNLSVVIRNAGTDASLGTVGTKDVSTLGGAAEITFNTTPITVENTAIRICAEYSGGSGSNYVTCYRQSTDVLANWSYSTYNGSWTDDANKDQYFICVSTSCNVYRGYVYFDTSAIPDTATITAATLKYYGSTDSSTTDFDMTVTNGQPNYPSASLTANDFNKTQYSGTGGTLNTSGFSIAGYNTLTLDANGLSWINITGTTKLCLMSSRDIAATTPTGNEYVTIYGADQAGTDKDPYLSITYTIPYSAVGTGITSGEHIVKTTYDGAHIILYIDGVEKQSTSATGGIYNNATNWTFVKSSAMPYVEYVKVKIGGVLKGSWAWQNAATFTDLSGNGNNATPSFKTTTSDADVTAAINGLEPSNESVLTGYQPTAAPAGLLTSVPPEPTVVVNQTTAWSKIPMGDVILSILDVSDIPPALFFMPVMLFLVLLAAFVTYHFTRDMLFTGIAGDAVMGAFISISALYVIPLIVGIVSMIVLLIKRKTVSL